MLFKKLTALTLKEGFTISLGDLEAAVMREPARECQYSEMEHLGFDFVFDGSRLRVWPLENEKVLYLKLTRHKRLLPASVLNAEVDKKCRKIEEDTGEKVKGKARRDIKDEIKQELLSKAFQDSKSIQVIINLIDGELWIDEASDSVCQKVRKTFAKVIGDIPLDPPPAPEALAAQMKEWLLEEDAVPAGIEILDKAKLVDMYDSKATMSAKGEELHSEEFKALLDHREVAELGVSIDSSVSCEITPKLILKAVKSETPAEQSHDDDKENGLADWFDSEVYLTFAELQQARKLLAGLARGGAHVIQQEAS
jgi:recombination associated protein RdgC